ncbi:MAG TPA: TetR/AcrR family transcriptional regulator [Pseudomonadales bacterium]|nr:TetR/AcrR family transcriptional regulator [Pseudomonadales bacterium]
MARPAQHRDRLLQTAVRLFRQQGYAATGLAEILAKSGAPRGSLYHHFPGGKEAVGAAAVALAGATVTQTLRQLLERTDSGAAFVTAYGALLAQWVAASDFRDGCPIATTLLETTPRSEAIAAAGAAAFEAWTALIARAFARDGLDADAAHAHALLVVAGVEGALLLARVTRSTAPVESVARSLARPAGV